jgi:UDP-N-acetylglucosamine 2-epimerase
MQTLLAALDTLKIQTLLLWPNIDAGSDHISKVIRIYRSQAQSQWMRTLTNLTPENYLRVLANTACAIGNSSSFVRDAGYFGTPVVLVGNRQAGREHDVHVVPVTVDQEAIAKAVARQLEHGRYEPSSLYGDGNVAARIASAIEKLTPYLQKQLGYTLESASAQKA